MQREDELRRRLSSTNDLKSVVRTMKSLAAVNITQFERAASSIRDYEKTVETALQIVFRHRDVQNVLSSPELQTVAAVVFGSAHGLCGQFNERIADHALSVLSTYNVKAEDRIVLSVGERLAARLSDDGQPIERRVTLSGSLGEIATLMQVVLDAIQEWQAERGVEHVFLFYNSLVSRAGYEPTTVMLLPIGSKYLSGLAEKRWDGPSLPTYFGEWNDVFSHTVRHHLFARLYAAIAQSLASENAARLAAMQAAENNIDEKLSELRGAYNRQRQAAITMELIDIVSGFEALQGKEGPG